MGPFIGVVVGVAILLGAVALATNRLRGARRLSGSSNPIEPRSLVHVINDEAELHDAARRAAQFDRDAAELLLSRADRYEAVAAAKPVTDIRSGRRLVNGASADNATRSA